jgi:hypothetical protein
VPGTQELQGQGALRVPQQEELQHGGNKSAKARGTIHHHYVVLLQEQMHNEEPYSSSFCYGLVGRKKIMTSNCNVYHHSIMVLHVKKNNNKKRSYSNLFQYVLASVK